MDLSQSDADLIARTAVSEASEYGPEGMLGVINSIKNRVNAGNFGDTPRAVVLSRGQYEPWGLSRRNSNHPLNVDPQSDDYQQALQLTQGVFGGSIPDNVNGATHFYDPQAQARLGRRKPDWAKGRQPVAQLGGHVFYTDPDAQNRPASSAPQPPQSDVLSRWGVQPPGPDNAAPAAPYAQPEDVFTRWGVTQPTGKEAVPEAPEPPITPQEALTATQRGLPAQAIGGVPILGPTINALQAAGSAASARPGETGDFESRFLSRLNEQRRADLAFASEHPIASGAASLGAGALATIPFSMTSLGARALGMEGSTLGSRVFQGIGGQSAIGAADAYLRGEDPTTGAMTGAAGGLLGPYVGEGAQMAARTIADARFPAGPLQGVNTVGRRFLVNALEGETPASIAAGQARVGPAGFVADIAPGLTDVAGGISDLPGPTKALVREAYRTRAEGAPARVEGALTNAFGGSTNIEDFKNFITQNRAAAADPLYAQWRATKVFPTQGIKDLMPRLEAADAFSGAQRLSGITGEPFDQSFFTTGTQKDYPTAQSWDLVKRSLDSKIDQAYSGGDKTSARALIGLRSDLIGELEQAPGGQIWKQARQEFADRSALLDQIAAGKDTFLGGRSGLSVDEMREELKGLSGPELAARVVGARQAADDVLGGTVNGDTTLRNKFLAKNNQDKLRLLIGDTRANQLISSLESERVLADQRMEVVGNKATGASAESRKQRAQALLPPPIENNWWNRIDLTKPTTLIPPHLSPLAVLEGARGARYGNALQQIAPLLTGPAQGPQANALLTSISQEATNRARVNDIGGRIGSLLTGLIAGAAPATTRNVLVGPTQ